MRLLWTFVKVVLTLCLVVPVAIIALSVSLGILGALVSIAVMVLRLAFFGLIVWWRRTPSVETGTPVIRNLPRLDPYLEAAKRELDQELGETSR